MAEVTKITFDQQQSSLDLNFFFKPFPPQNVSDSAQITKLSTKEQGLLAEVSNWNNLLIQNQSLIQQISIGASSSGSFNTNATGSALKNGSPFE